ncbi:MAG: FAD-dependent oxidoreductase [Clostridia bacterium]|nr:FAD-dependent oxidoreductase [Clostridia bacterium]
MKSIWSDAVEQPQFQSFEGTQKTDVLIIGGGICGILCAYMLKNRGVDCVVAEADKICCGITKDTTAKITYQHGLIYDKIIKKYGLENARLYFESQKEALDKYRKLCDIIACDFTECDSYVYSLDSREKIEREVDALNRLGCDAEFSDKTELPFSVSGGAVMVKNQAQFHPLEFAYQVAKELPIYENTKILELRPDGAITNQGKIVAEKIIVATHFPFINKHGGYFLKMYQHRSYVLALKGTPILKNMYVDESKTGLSFRSYGELLILGGGSHRTGKNGGTWNELVQTANNYYPDSQEIGRWATQDCMTLDGIPYIGQYSKNTPNLYVATGFNKWGMTSSMTAAMILCDMVLEKENKYANLFSPSRSILHPQLAINTVESILGLLTPTVPRCPHMGCALKYNKHEHSWDCPCHGSRFTEDGELIDNPATDDK